MRKDLLVQFNISRDAWRVQGDKSWSLSLHRAHSTIKIPLRRSSFWRHRFLLNHNIATARGSRFGETDLEVWNWPWCCWSLGKRLGFCLRLGILPLSVGHHWRILFAFFLRLLDVVQLHLIFAFFRSRILLFLLPLIRLYHLHRACLWSRGLLVMPICRIIFLVSSVAFLVLAAVLSHSQISWAAWALEVHLAFLVSLSAPSLFRHSQNPRGYDRPLRFDLSKADLWTESSAYAYPYYIANSNL